jgi:hypothetical protein
MFGRILIGIIGIATGCLLAIYHNWFTENVGRPAWADKYLGPFGGARLFYILLGILVVVIATLYMTGSLGPMIVKIFSRIFAGGAA